MHMSIFSENGYVFDINWSFFCLVQIQSRRGINWAKTQVICHFLKYGFLVLLEITYNESLQQFIASSTVKPMKKLLCQKRAKIYPKISFFFAFSNLAHYFSLKLHTIIAYNNVQHLLELKSTIKILGSNLCQRDQNQTGNQFFCHSDTALIFFFKKSSFV